MTAFSASEWRAAEEARIAELDPLSLDGSLARLPEWNARGEVFTLLATLAQHVRTVDLSRLSPPSAAAAMRDLGMFVASLKRHGIEAVGRVDGLEQAFITLGARTGMVPRDTVFHYGPWNPRGARQRMFTGDANEDGLIDCVRRATPGLTDLVSLLVELTGLDSAAPQFAEVGRRCIEQLRMALVEVISFANSNVSATFFAQELRPYFEAVTVAGRPYLGPAAAHIPLWLVDHLLWSSDGNDAELTRFQEEAAGYSPPHLRRLYRQTGDKPSLVGRFLAEQSGAGAPGGQRRESAQILWMLLRELVKFRGKHRVVALKAYAPKVRLYDVGSGGYSVVSLSHSLRLTLERAKALHDLLGHSAHESLELR
ncbi:MAG: monodechloroaminopyrrolnitrin synthase PrnB family protein [Myxococcaceae bacterium]